MNKQQTSYLRTLLLSAALKPESFTGALTGARNQTLITDRVPDGPRKTRVYADNCRRHVNFFTLINKQFTHKLDESLLGNDSLGVLSLSITQNPHVETPNSLVFSTCALFLHLKNQGQAVEMFFFLLTCKNEKKWKCYREKDGWASAANPDLLHICQMFAGETFFFSNWCFRVTET